MDAETHFHIIATALRRLTSGEITKLEYDSIIQNPTIPLSRLDYETHDKRDEEHEIVSEVSPPLDESRTDNGADGESVVSEDRHSDAAGDEILRAVGRNLMSG